LLIVDDKEIDCLKKIIKSVYVQDGKENKIMMDGSKMELKHGNCNEIVLASNLHFMNIFVLKNYENCIFHLTNQNGMNQSFFSCLSLSILCLRRYIFSSHGPNNIK